MPAVQIQKESAMVNVQIINPLKPVLLLIGIPEM